MGETQIVYKVVTKHWRPNEFTSASVADPAWMLDYELGKPTKPKRGYIFAFDTHDNAMAWLNMCYDHATTHHAVLESEAVVVDRLPVTMAMFLIDEFLYEFWSGRPPSYQYDSTPPRGTVWCSELTPMRVIEGDGYVHNDES